MTDEPRTVPSRRTDGRARRGRSSSGWSGVLRETGIIVVSAIVLSLLIKTFLAQAFSIPSQSMEQTLLKGDRVMVTRLAPGPFDLHRGDIVVFKDPGGWLTEKPVQPTGVSGAIAKALTFIGLRPQDAGQHLIKRLIGLPGDHVQCCDAQGRLMVNGVPIDEPYIAPGSVPSEKEFDVTVPADSLWVMGDNRQNSWDSRYHMGNPGGGSVPMENVVGVAFARLWPADRLTILHNPGATFAKVPDPS